MATAPTTAPAATLGSTSRGQHTDLVTQFTNVSNVRTTIEFPTGKFRQGWQSLIKFENGGAASALDGTIIRLWGIKPGASGDVEILVSETTLASLTGPDLPSEGAVEWDGETLYIQDPWGKYEKVVLDIDTTGATTPGTAYTVDAVVSSLG